MGLFNAVGQGLSAAGYAAGDLYGKGALMEQKSDLDLKEAQLLAQFKQALKIGQQATILGGGSMVDAMNASIGKKAGAPLADGTQPVADANQGDLRATAPVTSTASPQSAAATPTGDVSALDIPGLAKKYNIPESAIRYDLAMNEGKGVGAMIDKAAKGNKQVHGGVVVDMDKAPEGLINGQVFTSSDGKTIVINKGADGKPEVVVPTGALEAQAAQKGVEAGVKAATTIQKVWDPATQREVWLSEADILKRAGLQKSSAPQSPQAGDVKPNVSAQGKFVGDPSEVAAAISLIKDPQERANAQAALEKQMRETGGKLPNDAGPAAAGPSTAENTKAASQKEYATQSAKDIAEQKKTMTTADLAAPTNIARYKRIGELLANVDGGRWTPAGYEMASALNSVGIKVNDKLPNVQAAQAMANEVALMLRSPAGGAGMPGALSDKDREFLVSMTPSITQSAAGRKMVIDSYVALQQRNQQVAQFARNYEKKNGQLDNDFFSQLQAWSNDHPVFSTSGK